MKKMLKILKWLIFMGIFVLIGMGIALGIAETFHKIGNKDFCGGCHVMTPMVETWEQSVHGGNNEKGVVAECAACHTDHSSATAFTYVKVTSGLRDVINNALHKPGPEYFLNENNDASKYVYDSGCLRCHEAIAESPSVRETTRNLHEQYFEHRDENPALRCANCHKEEIAHPGLEDKLRELRDSKTDK
ncbi:MAG: cytochrome c3 family protein [Alphaproteobacteria bacterium]